MATVASNRPITFQELVEIHDSIDLEQPESRINAANMAIDRWIPDLNERVYTVANANVALTALYRSLLEAERYGAASVLCWGDVTFDPRPHFVRQVWKCLRSRPKLLIMGCGAGGKSYNCYVHDLHDWNRDPWYTTIKIISTTAGHAKAQAMSTFVRLHRDSVIPMPGYIRQGFIGMDKDDLRASISELAIDKGSEIQGKSGKLQGFHPYPRRKAHPVFGTMSRVRARLEECEDIPNPVWPGVTNLMLTAGGKNVSVAGLFNPRRRDSATAQRAEPLKGWGSFDIDRDEEWMSKHGFYVLRLDGAKCENVIEKKIVYPGLIDYEGFHQYDASKSDWYTFSRGAYPAESISLTVVPRFALEKAKGKFIWLQTPTPIGALDSARAQEGDNAIFTAARYGLAVGIEPEKGPTRMFDINRWCIQIDQQFPIQKQNTEFMGKDVIRICRSLRIRPEWFVMDRTGNAVGLHDFLVLHFGRDAMGIEWGASATDVPVMEEDTQKASELFADITSEMWFAFGAWAEFGYMAFAPHMDTSQLFAQMEARQYRYVSKTKRKIESKEDFKSPRRYGSSPDESDSAIMTVHMIRQRSAQSQRPAMTPEMRDVVRPDDVGEPVGLIHSGDSEEAIDAIRYL